MITLNLDVKSAAAIRQVLFDEQKIYTYDLKVYLYELLKFVM